MPMPMMRIWKMRMGMRQRRVLVQVAVANASRHHAKIITMVVYMM